jgi:hypothetical protein
VNNIAVKNNSKLSEYSLVTFPLLQVLYASETEGFFNSPKVVDFRTICKVLDERLDYE